MSGNRVSEDLISTVRLIVGSDCSEMDIIRALHLAKHDATAAINIIFDSPRSFKPREKQIEPELEPEPEPEPVVRVSSSDTARASVKPMKTGKEIKDCSFGRNGIVACGGSILEDEENVRLENNWWFVGSGEVPGLSTSKGRKVKVGEEVSFTFPLKSTGSSPAGSMGKGFGRGRAAAACSEIVRFSTKNSGEVIHFEFNS